MPELDLIIKHKRETENTNRKFEAAIQGIDLDKNNEKQNKIEEVKRRAQAKIVGEQELERQELADLGFGYESF